MRGPVEFLGILSLGGPRNSCGFLVGLQSSCSRYSVAIRSLYGRYTVAIRSLYGRDLGFPTFSARAIKNLKSLEPKILFAHTKNGKT